MGLVLRNPKAPCSISSLDRKRPLGRVKWAVLVGCLGGVEWKIQEAVPLRFLNSDPKCLYFCVFWGVDPPASFKWSGNDYGAVGSLTAVCGSHGLGGTGGPWSLGKVA